MTNDNSSNTQNTSRDKVFMTLDVKSTSFRSSTHGSGNYGILWVMLISCAYILFCVFTLDSFKMLFDVISPKKPLILFTIGFVLLFQKLVRVFIVKEDELLESFNRLTENKNVTIGSFHNLKPRGLEQIEGIGCKISYRSGNEGYILKLSRGSKVSDLITDSSVQVVTESKIINELQKYNLKVTPIIGDEDMSNTKAFKFFQNSLKTGNFDEDFVELCNSILMYHRAIEETHCRITATYLLVTANNPESAIHLEDYLTNLNNKIVGSNFRTFTVLDIASVLKLFANKNGLRNISEMELTSTQEARTVSLGQSKVVCVRKKSSEDINYINTPIKTFRNDGSKYDTYALNSPNSQSKKDSLNDKIELQNKTDTNILGYTDAEEHSTSDIEEETLTDNLSETNPLVEKSIRDNPSLLEDLEDIKTVENVLEDTKQSQLLKIANLTTEDSSEIIIL